MLKSESETELIAHNVEIDLQELRSWLETVFVVHFQVALSQVNGTPLHAQDLSLATVSSW